jgi:hypothetical protein
VVLGQGGHAPLWRSGPIAVKALQERADHIAEWVRLTHEKNNGAICADIARRRGQPQRRVNAAVRELGIERTDVRRAVKIAGISEAKRAGSEYPLRTSALITAAILAAGAG